jgi:nucleoside-diphosphate-sugar epimerase
MTISVYGGTGFIGGVFCQKYPDEVIKIKREIRQPESREILYFISTTSNYNVLETLRMDVDINISLLMEALENCKDKDIVFNYISTGFVYGNNIINAVETDNCNPGGFYSITKRSAEMLLISFCETFNVKYRILRLANVYGTEDRECTGKKNVLRFLIELLKKDKEISLYDGGDVLRDYLHVEDVCSAIKLVLKKGKMDSIYNIASGKPQKFYDIIMSAKKHLGSNSNITSIEAPEFYKKTQAKNFSLNVDKLKSLGFEEKIYLEEGIKLLCR